MSVPPADPSPMSREALQALPKVDLHRHLEGSMRLHTLCEIATEHGVPLPSDDLALLRPLVQVVDERYDFHAFLARFDLLRRFFSTREAIQRVAQEAVTDATVDGVRYLELRFSPSSLAEARGFSLEEVTESVIAGIQAGTRACSITVGLLLTIIRGSSVASAERIVDLALQYRTAGVVGVDLAGDEVRFPPDSFADVFRRARNAGLGVTIHAGEVVGADTIQTAVEELGAMRIGHGVQAHRRPHITELLRSMSVTLEMCPTSNLQTSAVSSLSRHPLMQYHRAGLRVSINTDNPSVSNTTLTDEYQIAVQELGATPNELREMILTGVRAGFIPDDQKQELEKWFQQAIPLP